MAGLENKDRVLEEIKRVVRNIPERNVNPEERMGEGKKMPAEEIYLENAGSRKKEQKRKGNGGNGYGKKKGD